MATYTSNLNLELPSYEDSLDVQAINRNMQTIDSHIHNIEASLQEKGLIVITGTDISNSNRVIYDDQITATMICTKAVLSNTSAQGSDWTVSTVSGAATILGDILDTTNIVLYLQDTNK